MAEQDPSGTRPKGDYLLHDFDYPTDPDTMSSAFEVVKSRTDDANPASTKPSSKKETPTKHGDSKSQPTSEQMRIAQLLSSKKEDPKLKEKLKQVMEATQSTMDKAYVALHDNEFDSNRAVNVLLEGDVEREWSTLSKKKKSRSPAEAKPEKSKIENTQEFIHQYESWEPRWVQDAKPSIGTRAQGFKRGRGGRSARGRGGSSQQSGFAQRGRRFNKPTTTTSESCETEEADSIIQSRTFERVNPTAVRPADKWDPNRPIATMLNQKSNDELEEEEYTGSLASSLVYTSTGSIEEHFEQTEIMDIPPRRETRSPNLYDDSINTPTLPSLPTPPEGATIFSVVPQSNPSTSMSPQSYSTSVMEALQVRLPQLAADYTTPLTVYPPEESNTANVTRKPFINLSKLPKSIQFKPIEIFPCSAKSNVDLLDVKFESLNVNESSGGGENSSLQPSDHPTSQPTGNAKTNLKKSDSYPISFAGRSIAVSIPQTSSTGKGCTGCSTKLQVETPKYSGGLVMTTAHIISTSHCQSSYAVSSVGGSSTGMSNVYPHFHSGCMAHPPQSIPLAPNYPYQNVLGAQPYASGSQSIYPSNAPPTSSYTTPFQPYGNTAQHNPTLPQPFKTSRSFDSQKSLSTRSAVTTASSMHPTHQSLPSAIPSTVPNMPPMIGHQHPMFIGQGGIQYYQHPPIYYQGVDLVQQQRLPSPMNTGYYEMGYPPLARDNVPFNPNAGVPFNQGSSHPVPQAHQMAGASGHSSSNAFFGTETERYLDPPQNPRRRNAMGSSSNDPKRNNVFKKKK